VANCAEYSTVAKFGGIRIMRSVPGGRVVAKSESMQYFNKSVGYSST